MGSCSRSEIVDILKVEKPSTNPTRKVPTIRIIHVNDVYTLDNFASFYTLINEYKTEHTVVTHGGDFVAPYLLSSLDHGKGMIKMMNAVGFDIACFGNHESDIKLQQLYRRIDESEFAWVNSNMPGFVPPSGKLPRYVIKEVQGRKVAFIGLCTEKENQYKKGRFQNCEIFNVNDTAVSVDGELKAKGVDLVVCMTHQNMPEDRDLAKREVFPLILGGHDHDLFHETYGRTQLLKVGENMETVGIIDITLDGRNEVTVKLLDVHDFAPDARIQQVAEDASALLRAIETTKLLEIPDGVVLTAKNARRGPNQLASLIATSRKDVLGADCGFFHGGGVRGGEEFKEYLTLANLLATMPFSANIGRVEIPGQVINDMVRFSREPLENGNPAFLHADKYMMFDDDGNICEINMKPFDPEKMYLVGMDLFLLGGGNSIEPLNVYMDAFKPDIYDGAQDLSITVTYLCDMFWLHFAEDVSEGKCERLGNADSLAPEDVRRYMLEKFGDNALPDLMTDLFFNAAAMDAHQSVDMDGIRELLKFNQINFTDIFENVSEVDNIISRITRQNTLYLEDFEVNRRYDFSGQNSFALLPSVNLLSDEEIRI